MGGTPAARHPAGGESRRAGFREVFDGFAYLATQKVLLASFVVDIIAMVFGMPRALFPQIAHDTFGDPATGGVALGLLFAAMSVGAVAGGVFSGWLPRVRRQGLAVIVCIALWGLAMLGFGLVVGVASPGSSPVLLWAALAFLAFGGAVDMVSAAFRSTMLQQVATDEMRGRLQGCSSSSSPADPASVTSCTALPPLQSERASPRPVVASSSSSVW